VQAHLGSPGKGPLNGCVCVLLFIIIFLNLFLLLLLLLLLEHDRMNEYLLVLSSFFIHEDFLMH